MKYITEEELRDLCNIQAFETFTLTAGVKLTPGGRQYLADRKIPVIVQGEQKAIKTISIPANECDKQTEKSKGDDSNTAKDRCIDAHFALLEAVFFKQAIELLDRNPVLANQIYDMKCSLESIACRSKENIVSIEPIEITTKEQLGCPPKEGFQIRRDVMFAEHGKEVAVLHLLRCELQKFYLDNGDILTEEQKNYLAYLMNNLSKMLRNILDGDDCKRDVVE